MVVTPTKNIAYIGAKYDTINLQSLLLKLIGTSRDCIKNRYLEYFLNISKNFEWCGNCF